MSSFTLKVIALVLMIFDHIHHAFPETPILFTQIGRLSAPIFIFITAVSMGHTKRPDKFVLRLYIASALMSAGNMLFNYFVYRLDDIAITNNIFGTLFLITYTILFLEKFRSSSGKRTALDSIRLAFMLLLPSIFSVLMLLSMQLESSTLLKIMMIFTPNLIFVEGSFMFVLLGVGFYYTRNNKVNMMLLYSGFSALILALTSRGDYSYENLININFQWLMIFSLPLLYSYNNKRGYSLKWFFYWFYPFHIYLLAILSKYNVF